MNRTLFRKLFKTVGPAILPVIHVIDAEQTERNIRTLLHGGVQGVFLINHDFPRDDLVPIIRQMRETFPALWLGVNFLAVTGRDAFPILGKLEAEGCPVDGYWADDARIDERASVQTEADDIDAVRASSGWTGLYFGGTAFKKQREVSADKYASSASTACNYMDVVTTSGIATGKAADISKIKTFREACGEQAIGIASGVTPENVHLYADLVDAILVATGINFDGDFYNADPQRVAQLMLQTRTVALGPPAGVPPSK